jgi:hypothetical protein
MLRSGFLRTRALAVFAWERMPGFVLDLPSMLILAASAGCVGTLEELVDNRQCELAAGACIAAAGKGQLDALIWLHSRGCPWGIATCNNATAGGHLEVLRYAHEHGCPWDWRTCWLAAGGGHLEALRYAHEHGCPWDSDTCYHAACNGNLEVLRYAYEHGCPLYTSIRKAGARTRRLCIQRTRSPAAAAAAQRGGRGPGARAQRRGPPGRPSTPRWRQASA